MSDSRITAVHVFGSRAKGTHRADSDLDVALSVSDDEEESAFVYWVMEGGRMRDELAPLVPVKIHLQPAFPDDTVVQPAIDEHGICIYRQR
jgi:predicted nucleotidyltransferase